MPPYNDPHHCSSLLGERRPLTHRVNHLSPTNITAGASSISDHKTPPSSPIRAHAFSLSLVPRNSRLAICSWILLAFMGGILFERGFLGGIKQPDVIQVTANSTLRDEIVTYGHVHMAKTGGTALNGELALRYERVCGHKGYSYDAILYNQRIKQLQKQSDREGFGLYQAKDSFTTIKKGYNRGRVPPKVMWEIGFHDCDWISIEDPGWRAWEEHVRDAVEKLELHVPCRDPIDHLLSSCNFRNIQFECKKYENSNNPENHRQLKYPTSQQPATAKRKPFDKFRPKPDAKANTTRKVDTLEEQIDSCMLGIHRFDYNLTKIADAIKCFDFSQQTKYMQYMDQRLQKRRFTEDYVDRASDRPRHKDKECLLKASDSFKQRVRNYLIDHYDYYHFCNQCMGGEQDLFK